MSAVKPGDILAGKFRIERVLGQGGMGVVVSAQHLQLDDRVAIKFLLPDALSNGEVVARFAREARAAVKIKSEHVARVSDVGTLENGAPYMVMEYLDGQDLSVRVKEGGPIAISDAVDFVLQACEALAEAHALGIIHRDLKPANMFLTRRTDGSPCVKVLDFGISKITSPSNSGPDFGMTRTQSVMGSPLYMSPEQMASTKLVDQRTDIWAMGITLYELCAGRVPFNAETMPQLCAMILQEQAPPPRDYRPDLPADLQDVILRCIEKDKARRYQNVAELAAALVPFGSQHTARSAERISRVLGVSAADSSVTLSKPTASSSAPANTQASWGTTGSKPKSKLPRVIVGAGVALVVLATIGMFVLKSPSAAAPESSASTESISQAAPTAAASEPPAPAIAATENAVPPSPAPAASPSVSTSGAATLPKAVKPVAVAKPKPAGAAAAAPAPAPKPAIDPLEGRR